MKSVNTTKKKIENNIATIEFKQGLSLKNLNMETLTKKIKEFTKIEKIEYKADQRNTNNKKIKKFHPLMGF